MKDRTLGMKQANTKAKKKVNTILLVTGGGAAQGGGPRHPHHS